MDLVHDRLANGRWFKCLTMTELCSKEVPVIKVDNSIGGEHAVRTFPWNGIDWTGSLPKGHCRRS